jgi:hypothetical protein
MYPQKRGGPVIPPGTGFPFCRLLGLAGTTVEVFYPASTRETCQDFQKPEMYMAVRTSQEIPHFHDD